eukprot:scaffold9523_cov103-Cylindrotheca_fusiformis.AAC.23
MNDDEEDNRKFAAVRAIDGGNGQVNTEDHDNFVYSNETKRKDIPNKEMLTHLLVDSSVKEVPEYLFKSCFVLSEVQLPYTLSRIGRRAFSRCLSLRSIRFFSTNATPSSIHLEDRLAVFFPTRLSVWWSMTTLLSPVTVC